MSSSDGVPHEIGVVAVCEHMHWTYQQYLDQPSWFLDVLHIKMIEDAEFNKPKGKGA